MVTLALMGLTTVWLALLAWFDLRTRAVPHIAWVSVPLLGAMIWRFLQGDWAMPLSAALCVLASERHQWRVPALWPVVLNAGLLCGLAVTQPTGLWIALIGGAWLNYELGHWGGADALAVMTLIVLWPDWRLGVACGVVLGGVVLVQRGKARRWPALALLAAGWAGYLLWLSY